ncbi:MAG: CrcB family protein [Actinomycetota bacterium]
MNPVTWAALGAACSAGAVARHLVAGWIEERAGGRLAWGTWSVNLTGSLALGLLVGSGVGGVTLLVAGTGFCGTYTTFSTLTCQTVALSQEGNRPAAWLNAVGQVLAGLTAAGLGLWWGGL